MLFQDFVWSLPKSLDFGYFVLIWWQIDEKQEINSEADLQGPIYLDKTANFLIDYRIR